MTPLPRLVLFDLMETLLTVRDEQTPYWQRIAAFLEQGGYVDSAEFARRYSQYRLDRRPSNAEVPLRDRIAMFASIPSGLHDSIERWFVDDYFNRSRIVDGVEAMLDRWRGVAALGVVSNFFVAGAPRELLARHGLIDRFEFVVDSAQVGVRKPDAAIFERAIERWGRRPQCPSDVLMIGDNREADVDGARALGFRAVHFSREGSGARDVPVNEQFIEDWRDFAPGAL